METYVTHHERCPDCAKLGKDNSHDNLAYYSDGHCWCFSCGYYRPGSRIKTYRNSNVDTPQTTSVRHKEVRLPSDCSSEIPRKAREWFYQYGLTEHTITKHTILWSDSRHLLIFPYFIDGVLVGWQGRYFGLDTKHPKWYTNGLVDSFIYTLGKPSDTIVLVEDIVSAIKVSRCLCSSPLFGSVISMSRFNALRHFYKNIVIWLDPDKYKEAIKFAQKGRLLGLNCHVILSSKDPKEHNFIEIQSFLDKYN